MYPSSYCVILPICILWERAKCLIPWLQARCSTAAGVLTVQRCSSDPTLHPDTADTGDTGDIWPCSDRPWGHWAVSWCWSAQAWPRHLEAGARARTTATPGPGRPPATLTRCLDTTPSNSQTIDSTTGQVWRKFSDIITSKQSERTKILLLYLTFLNF